MSSKLLLTNLYLNIQSNMVIMTQKLSLGKYINIGSIILGLTKFYIAMILHQTNLITYPLKLQSKII